MKYDEKTALKVQQQFGISDNAKKLWKFRDNIPERFFDKGFSPLSYAEDDDTAMLRTVLAIGKTSIKNLCASLEIPYLHVQDAIAGKNRMREDFASRLAESLRSFADEAKTIIDSAKGKREVPERAILLFGKFVAKKELSMLDIFDDRKKYDTIQAWKRGRRVFPFEHFPYFLEKLKIFHQQHSI